MSGTKIRMLVGLIAMGAAAAGLAAASCGGDDSGTPDSGDVSDTGHDTAHDTGEHCPPASFPSGTTEMRLMRLNITAPAAMRNEILQGLVTSSMDQELFIWLLKFTGVGTGTLNLETGSGQKVTGTNCTYSFLPDPYPPDSMTMGESGTSNLDFALTGTAIAQLDVPMWATDTAYPDPPLLVLPLRELQISGTFSSDHLTIGTYDSVAETWTDGGTLQGKVTAADANNTVIDLLGMTLCGLVSGATGVAGDPSDDCEGDPTTWPRPPDTTVGSDPAYNMAGTISATAVYISE